MRGRRKQWKDADDVIVTAWLGSGPVGNTTPGASDIMVWGLGQRLKIGSWPKCQTAFRGEKDGSGVVSGGGLSMAVDFSGQCGAPGLVVLAGEQLGKEKTVMPTGTTLRNLTAGKYSYRILTLQKTDAPEIRTEGASLTFAWAIA